MVKKIQNESAQGKIPYPGGITKRFYKAVEERDSTVVAEQAF